jgi:PDZ domain
VRRAAAQVKKFNGQDITSLEQLAAALDACTAPFCVFELDFDEVLVLDRAEAEQSTAAVLAAHNIPHRFSPDLRQKAEPGDGKKPEAASGEAATDGGFAAASGAS